MEIYEALKKEEVECELEKRLASNIADVYAVVNGHPVAIEVQVSNLSPEKIAERTSKYHQNGIAVIWLLPDVSERPTTFQRWIYLAQGEKVYCWKGGLELDAYHFGKKRQASTFRGKTLCTSKVDLISWYQEEIFNGIEKGYEAKYLHLLKDFQPVNLSERFIFDGYYRGWEFEYPEMTLFLDSKPQWFETWRDKKARLSK